MAINNFGGEWRENKWDEKEWSASQCNTIRQPLVRAALCSLSPSFCSQCFLAATNSRNVRLLCAPLCWSARVWVPGPELLLAIQLSLGWVGLHCTTLHSSAMHWSIVISAAPGGKRSRSLAPQQGMVALSCVRRWWLPDGGRMREEEGPTLSPSYSLSILCAFIL